MKFTWLSVAFVLFGCSQSNDTPSEVKLEPRDPSFTFLYYPGPGIDLDVAAEGAEKLLELGIEALPTSDLPSAQVRLRFILCDSDAHMQNPYMAITYPCGDVEICSQYDQAPYTYAHELGHALGMQHITTPGIMFPRLNTVQDFTTNDLHEFEHRIQAGSIYDPACADHWKDPLRKI